MGMSGTVCLGWPCLGFWSLPGHGPSPSAQNPTALIRPTPAQSRGRSQGRLCWKSGAWSQQCVKVPSCHVEHGFPQALLLQAEIVPLPVSRELRLVGSGGTEGRGRGYVSAEL